jgi:hypothetical protein
LLRARVHREEQGTAKRTALAIDSDRAIPDFPEPLFFIPLRRLRGERISGIQRTIRRGASGKTKGRKEEDEGRGKRQRGTCPATGGKYVDRREL